MKNAFIIWTPLHLYNVLCYITSNDMIGENDAYYISQSDGMELYYENCLKNGIFRRIYYTNSEKVSDAQKTRERIGVLISPKLYIKHLFGGESVNNEYDKIFISVPTRINDFIVLSNSCRSVVGYDDGRGSYTSDLYGVSLGEKFELIRKIRFGKRQPIKSIYLSRPELRLEKEDGIEYKELKARTLSKQDKKVFQAVFGEVDQTAWTSKAIFLNQPLKDRPDSNSHKRVEKQIIEKIRDLLGDDFVVRLHPRETEGSFYEGVKIHTDRQMWEMVCDECISGDSILIASFSTAQFTPKLFFDKEPTLIFTFGLYDDYTDEERKEFTDLIDKIRELYSDNNKVITPGSIDEMSFLRMI